MLLSIYQIQSVVHGPDIGARRCARIVHGPGIGANRAAFRADIEFVDDFFRLFWRNSVHGPSIDARSRPGTSYWCRDVSYLCRYRVHGRIQLTLGRRTPSWARTTNLAHVRSPDLFFCLHDLPSPRQVFEPDLGLARLTWLASNRQIPSAQKGQAYLGW